MTAIIDATQQIARSARQQDMDERIRGVGFEEFVTPRLQVWLRLATGLCGDVATAEDLLQDVLVKMYRGWRRVESAQSPDAYARRMITNEFLSWRRRAVRLVLTDDPPVVADGTDHGQQLADRAALRGELGRLPRRQQVVLAMRFYLGLSDADIAYALDCSEGTVRSHASRALASLRVNSRTQLQPTEGQVS